MENTEKITQNENKEKSSRGKIYRNFRNKKGRNHNRNTKPRDEVQNSEEKTNIKPVKPQKAPTAEKRHSVQNVPSSAKPKEAKKSQPKEPEIVDFVIGEFEENGKKYAFKMVKRVYFIVQIIEETEKEIFKTNDSKAAYFEWCKIKYPEKVKKSMI